MAELLTALLLVVVLGSIIMTAIIVEVICLVLRFFRVGKPVPLKIQIRSVDPPQFVEKRYQVGNVWHSRTINTKRAKKT